MFPFEHHFCIWAFLCVCCLRRHFGQKGGTYAMLTAWHELERLKILKSNTSSWIYFAFWWCLQVYGLLYSFKWSVSGALRIRSEVCDLYCFGESCGSTINIHNTLKQRLDIEVQLSHSRNAGISVAGERQWTQVE